MGLDMYLSLQVHVSNYDFSQGIAQAIFKALNIADPTPFSNGSLMVELPVGYWRKANAIHHWFVENVQGGEDECNKTPVDNNQLEALREICQKVLDDPSTAADTLPTKGGFFFGSTTYDDDYFKDLRDTIKIIDRALPLAVQLDGSFNYCSSW